MSITVLDCLRLSSLRDAEVIAGHKGLSKTVSAVSVLEYAKISALESVLFSGNELILTAFSSVADSVDEQCFAIKRLHEMGEVGLVIYYVGYFLPSVDQRLIDLADELDFPLILMPPNVYHHRYSDVITEVMSAVFENNNKDSYLVPEILESISKLNERQRTLSGALRLISARLQCSLMILDCDGREFALSTWPLAATEDFVNSFRSAVDNFSGENSLMVWHGVEYKIRKCSFDTDNRRNISLFILKNAPISKQDVDQSVEVLRVFCNVSKNCFCRESADDLVRAVLNNQQPTVSRLAKQLHIDLSKIRVMWILRNKGGDRTISDVISASKIKDFFRDSNNKRVFADTFDNSIVVFTEETGDCDEDWLIAQQFLKVHLRTCSELVLIWCGGMDSVYDAQQAYLLSESCFNAVCKIYPRKNAFSLQELIFAEECLRIMNLPRSQINNYLSVLTPLRGQNDEEVIIQTLSAYLLDADSDLSKAGKLLFVHEGTIKYRINKAQKRLGYSIKQMPGSYSLYLALAVNRMSL
ncbi:MAG: PucR family transcriptional regulator ligand-binding domain-containing protein [Oscillospiraceae bacterium]|nr:PucR family transcriptional regulator ligand-binding domain-containing protein [Oscillospiraceae bacterium]